MIVRHKTWQGPQIDLALHRRLTIFCNGSHHWKELRRCACHDELLATWVFLAPIDQFRKTLLFLNMDYHISGHVAAGLVVSGFVVKRSFYQLYAAARHFLRDLDMTTTHLSIGKNHSISDVPIIVDCAFCGTHYPGPFVFAA